MGEKATKDADTAGRGPDYGTPAPAVLASRYHPGLGSGHDEIGLLGAIFFKL